MDELTEPNPESAPVVARRFTWDLAKAARNVEKHGVTFNEAQTVFDDPHAQLFYDADHSADEDREIVVGHSIRQRLLVVSFTERMWNLIRIISARLATRAERSDYAERPPDV